MKRITMIKMFVLGAIVLFTMQAVVAQNNALNFVNANSTYVSVPVNGHIPATGENYTIETWFYANSMGTFGLVGWGDYGNLDAVNALRLDASGYIVNYWWNDDLAVNVGDISGAWHHVAVTWDGTTRSMYLDGALIGSDNPSGTYNVINTTNLTIGLTWPGGNEYFDGSIDETSIWNVCLTPAQVLASMSNSLCVPQNGLDVYFNYNQGTAGGTNTGISTITDVSGNGNPGILTNFALTGSTSNFVTGVTIGDACISGSNALNFDGLSTYAEAGTILTPSYTKEAWVYMTADVGSNNVISGAGNGNDDAFWIPGDQLSAGHNGNWQTVEDPNPFPYNTWVYIAVTYDANSQLMTLYRNGIQVDQETSSPMGSPDNTLIGSYGYGNFFQGSIDEVRIYDHALTAYQVQNDMGHQICTPETGLLAYYTFNQGIADGNNGFITALIDSSGNGNNATLNYFALTGTTSNFVPGVSIATSCMPAQALNFDGVDDYAISSVFTTQTDSITMEARVMWNGSTGAYQQIIVNGNTGNAGYAITVDHGNNDKLSVLLGSIGLLQSNAKLTVGQWQMVSVVRSKGTWTLYLDGVSYSLTANTSSPNAVSGNFVVGANQGGTENFNGSIDEVRIWSRALCQGEIQSNLAYEVPGNDTALLALYYFNVGNAGTNNTWVTSVADSSMAGSPSLTLNNFALNGSSSNFIAPAGTLTGYDFPYNPSIPTVYTSGALTFCQGDSVVLTVDAGDSYVWNNNSSSTTQSITIKTSGVYQAKITGCYRTTFTTPVTVTVNATPVVTITDNVINGGGNVCIGTIDSLMANVLNSTATPFMYNWSTGSTNDTALVSPIVNTSYSLIVTDQNACADTLWNIAINANPVPQVTVVGNVAGNIICSGLADSLTAQMAAKGIYTFSWSNGSTNDTALVTPTSNATYSLVVANGFGCTDTVYNIQVAVNQTPSVSFTGDPGSPICAGQNDTITEVAHGTGALTYLWNTGGTNDSINVHPATTTTYSVLVTDPDGCNIVDIGVVTVNQLPVIDVSGYSGTYVGDIDTLTATGALNYMWTTGSTNDTASIQANSAGVYTYTVTGTDANGCSDTASFKVTVSVFTGVNNITSGNTALYPNPARNTVYLSFAVNGSESAVVKVISMSGEEVSSSNATISNGMQLPIDVSTLAPGNYFVKVITNTNTKVVKFVKE
ncbi:MAG TPA: LamG-like jellyroll fold domain-containing protein [Bacteroidia bacterium]|jgi:hypothetical protein|nr:LamG-like jellyroll fold domain-containing protein [Bacteroidia bacterium]